MTDVNTDILERQYITGVQQCSECERETSQPLEDGRCSWCLNYRSATSRSYWRVEVPEGPGGEKAFSILHVSRKSAAATQARWPGSTIRETKW